MLLSERFVAVTPAAGPATSATSAPPATAAASAAPESSRNPGRLPVETTSLIGREEAIGDVTGILGRPDVRLVTLTGPGGIGKSRLGVAVGEQLRNRVGAGTAYVSLASVVQPELVVPAIARAVGADLAGTDSPLEAAGWKDHQANGHRCSTQRRRANAHGHEATQQRAPMVQLAPKRQPRPRLVGGHPESAAGGY